jgi:hypothetical protein
MKKTIWCLIAILCLYEASALSCTCAPPDNVEDEFVKSTAVYKATVQNISRVAGAAWENLAIRSTVDQSWKGLGEQETITVRTASSSAACGFTFRVGETYLIYAFLNSEGFLVTNNCRRTKNILDAEEDIAILNRIGHRIP